MATKKTGFEAPAPAANEELVALITKKVLEALGK